MPKKKRTMRKKTTKKKSSTGKKPIGFVKQKGKYKLVFGSKSKPRLGKSSFKTKSALVKKARTLLKK